MNKLALKFLELNLSLVFVQSPNLSLSFVHMYSIGGRESI